MSAKDCGNHDQCKRNRFYRRIFACGLGFIILVLFIILLVWLILRPSKPKFYIQDASIYQFNLSDPNLLTSTIQVTITSRNPNDNVGIYYDKLDVYAAYKYQQITLATAIPPIYQGHNDVEVWSPYLYGNSIPIAPYLGEALGEDKNAGFLMLYVKIDGRLRWKVGSWTSNHYHVFVNCPAFLSFKDNGGSVSIKFQHLTSCSVDV